MTLDLKTIVAGKRRRTTAPEPPAAPVVPAATGDEYAALCTALCLYFGEMHDKEKYAMTIKRVSRPYSPWSSKLYGTYDVLKRR